MKTKIEWWVQVSRDGKQWTDFASKETKPQVVKFTTENSHLKQRTKIRCLKRTITDEVVG